MPKNSRKPVSGLDEGARLPRHMIVLIVGVFVLLVGGGAGLVYFSVTGHTTATQATPTSTVHAVPSATPHAKPTPQASPTSHASPTPQVSPTVSALQNPYPPHRGSLVLNDPLKDNSKGYRWDVGTLANGASCAFAGGSYHVGESVQGRFLACNAEAVTFGNLTYEVQMKILKGDRGGIFFRQVGTQGAYYYFSIKIDGSYEFDSFNGRTSSVLKRGTSAVVKKGLNQPNLLAVVAQGNSMNLYVNGQSIIQITDGTSSSGLIGVAADATDQPVEAAFNNARVWML